MKQIKHDADVPSTVAQYERKHDAVPSSALFIFAPLPFKQPGTPLDILYEIKKRIY